VEQNFLNNAEKMQSSRRNKAGFPAASFLAACFARLSLLFPKKILRLFSEYEKAVAFLRP